MALWGCQKYINPCIDVVHILCALLVSRDGPHGSQDTNWIALPDQTQELLPSPTALFVSLISPLISYEQPLYIPS